MNIDPRDQLWETVFKTLYDTHYQELFADDLVTRWRNIDELTKVIVAFTTTGSVVVGWALWETQVGQFVWASIAGVAAILAIIHATLGVPTKLKDWGEVKQNFTALRIDLETFRYQMEIDSNFQLDEFKQKFNNYRSSYRDGMQHVQNDMFRTLRRAKKIQSYLNEQIKEMTAE